ncbi:MAG: 16S rRNA (cytosine(967)-C(5))-methyltransferase RsmB [Clostridia bacterium]|nr:16S rRNA (cytosine(967)-C(5))-methyltransferase RsmB [Clostridia bacterium]
MNVRQEALSLLMLHEETDGYINLVLSDKALEKAGSEAGFLTALVYGTVERKLTLDYATGVLAEREPGSLRPHTRHLLRMGLYELFFLKTKPYAAVNETVKLCKDKGEAGFVNAVLRSALKRDTLPLPSRDRYARFLSLRESFPLPTVKCFIALFGEEKTEQLLSFFNQVSPLCLRLNPEKIDRNAYLSLLRENGYDASATPFSPFGVRISTPVSPKNLPGFAEGWFFVQDEASQIHTLALNPQKGDLIVDVCACPGGKTFGAAWAAGEGDFYAFDLRESKLSLIKESAERLGLSVTVACVDGERGEPSLFGKAGRVICDVPCSGLGVLGKKPDLRYRKAAGDLPALQRRILDTSARYVKDGGLLLYSTCTLLPEENEEQRRYFLDTHPDFTFADFSFGDRKSKEGEYLLTPFDTGTDGFYLAAFRKLKQPKKD